MQMSKDDLYLCTKKEFSALLVAICAWLLAIKFVRGLLLAGK